MPSNHSFYIELEKECGGSVAANFQFFIHITAFPEEKFKQLSEFLQKVEPLLPFARALDTRHTEIWARWQQSLSSVLAFLKVRHSIESGIHYQNEHLSWFKQLDTFYLPASLSADIPPEAGTRLSVMKAILLIGHHADQFEYEAYREQSLFKLKSLQNVADTLRKCAKPDWVNFPLLLRYVPEWKGSAAVWRQQFLELTSALPKYKNAFQYPEKHEYLHTLRNILHHVSLSPAHSPHDEQGSPEVLPEQRLPEAADLVVNFAPGDQATHEKKKETRLSPSFDLFAKYPPTADGNVEGLPPAVLHVVPQSDTPIDEPAPLASLNAVAVQYTNYRTAMDNQRLPWSWDSLNRFEVGSLITVLNDTTYLKNLSPQDNKAAFLIWLLLLTGKTVKEVLRFYLGEKKLQCDSLMPGGVIWRRYFRCPPHAFSPSPHQDFVLEKTAAFMELPISPPLPTMLAELGLGKKAHFPECNLGTYINFDSSGAEKAIRQFLTQHRTRDIRLLPGRIRRVLAQELMRITNDPVITHLISSLPTDMPPMGIYYTTYSADVLRQVYKDAISNIFATAG